MFGIGILNMTTGRLVAVKQLPEKLSVKQGRVFFRDVESCLKADRPRVVLDCSRVQKLDSAGIHVLLRCLEEAMKRNGDVRLAAVPQEAAAILELTRVNHLFETFDSTADAVNSFDQFPTKSFQQVRGHDCSFLPLQARHGFEDGQSDSGAELPVSPATMTTSGGWLRRQIAGCLLLLLVAPLAAAAPSLQQAANDSQQADSAQPKSEIQIEPPQSESLPNSPGAVRSQNELPSVQQSSSKLQTGKQEPLGTAAAPSVKTTGVAASRPAGAAIAPAKQRRARSILIKVGVIVGAGVAVATVVALSSGSPSRAPGSH